MGPKDRLLQYLDHLDRIFGREPKFYPFKNVMDGLPEILCLVYQDCPEAGHTTGVTWGLSEASHPDWVHSHPELMITVRSTELAWPLAAAELVRQLRSKCPFCYGDVVGFGGPVSNDSEMSAFFVFQPSIFDSAHVQNIPIGDKRLNIAGLYPIYESEREVISRDGLKAFWHYPNFDLYDVNRPRVTIDD